MSWTKELRTAIKSSKELNSFLEKDIFQEIKDYPIFIPIKYASHIKTKNSFALNNQFLPTNNEQKVGGGLLDPIGDSKNSKGDGIIHRYKNRILFSPTTKCPINCRYCFRKNELHSNLDIFKASLDSLKQYLKENESITELILTGGDPFFISNSKLKKVIELASSFKHIKHIRFHSRFPIIMPSRFDDELFDILNSSSKKIIIAIHSNHTHEFNKENEALIRKLRYQNFNLISQTVLLKGVNNDSNELLNLFEKFDDLGIRPYYLHHPDRVKGAMHFYLSIEEGREIYSKLRDQLSGWLLPHYVIDNFLGQGKQLAFNPESIEFSGQMLDKSNNKVSFLS